MSDAPQIDIVDDDPAVRDALATLFEIEEIRVRTFADGASFLQAIDDQTPACVLLDVHMPGKSGLDILRDLHQRNFAAPVFVISGQGDIPMAVKAIKDGAFDFIEKPFDAETILDRVRSAISKPPSADGHEHLDFPGKDSLTPRELDVLGQITGGLSNKEAAQILGISPRTVEVHRARIMEKIGARNAADLVRMVLSVS